MRVFPKISRLSPEMYVSELFQNNCACHEIMIFFALQARQRVALRWKRRPINVLDHPAVGGSYFET